MEKVPQKLIMMIVQDYNHFADLAKEMTDTFDSSAMEKDGEPPQNIGDVLQFMS